MKKFKFLLCLLCFLLMGSFVLANNISDGENAMRRYMKFFYPEIYNPNIYCIYINELSNGNVNMKCFSKDSNDKIIITYCHGDNCGYDNTDTEGCFINNLL